MKARSSGAARSTSYGATPAGMARSPSSAQLGSYGPLHLYGAAQRTRPAPLWRHAHLVATRSRLTARLSLYDPLSSHGALLHDGPLSVHGALVWCGPLQQSGASPSRRPALPVRHPRPAVARSPMLARLFSLGPLRHSGTALDQRPAHLVRCGAGSAARSYGPALSPSLARSHLSAQLCLRGPLSSSGTTRCTWPTHLVRRSSPPTARSPSAGAAPGIRPAQQRRHDSTPTARSTSPVRLLSRWPALIPLVRLD